MAQMVSLPAGAQIPCATHVDWLQVQGFLDMAESALRAKNAANDVGFALQKSVSSFKPAAIKCFDLRPAATGAREDLSPAGSVSADRASTPGTSHGMGACFVTVLDVLNTAHLFAGGNAKSSRRYSVSETTAGSLASGDKQMVSISYPAKFLCLQCQNKLAQVVTMAMCLSGKSCCQGTYCRA